MTLHLRVSMLGVLLFALLTATSAPASAQEENDISDYLNGQKFLFTSREGGPIYGTYIFLQVQFCSSGTYLSHRQTRKQTVMGNEQVTNWSDQGTWVVTTINGVTGVRSRSVSGSTLFVPARLLPGQGLWVGQGISVVRQGRAACR